MVTRNVRVCDAFGTTRQVKRFRVLVDMVDDEGSRVGEMFAEIADLSPLGLLRLKKFIRRGMAATNKGEEEGGTDANKG